LLNTLAKTFFADELNNNFTVLLMLLKKHATKQPTPTVVFAGIILQAEAAVHSKSQHCC